jgi:cell division protein FtsQ
MSALGRLVGGRRGPGRNGGSRSRSGRSGPIATTGARVVAWLLRPRVLLSLIGLLLALAGGWMWLRDSSLVAVTRVSVSGVSGADAAQIRQALESSARNMTTLDVSLSQLRTAVAPYPVVKAISVSTQFPHGMRISVIEQRPVGAIVVAGRQTAVAADGTLLHDVVAPGSLPSIPVRIPPGGDRVSEPGTRNAVALLAAAPYQFLPRISQVITVSAHGLVAQLRNGPTLYFGAPTRLDAKWAAVTAVLANQGSNGAAYIDVTDPVRPAAGATRSSPSTTSSTSAAGAAAPPTTTVPGG